MGHCKYVLAQDSVANTFVVIVDNFPCGTDNSQACTKTVTVHFNTTDVHLKRGSSVAINGEDLAMFPYKHNGKVHLLSYKFLEVTVKSAFLLSFWLRIVC